MKRKIILIGGAPTTGKSTIAKALAAKFNLPWISTDQIRDILITLVDKKKYPTLFTAIGTTAEKYLTKYTASQVVKMEMEQGKVIWQAIKFFVEQDYLWDRGFVIEGVGILPSLVRKYKNNKEIKAIFLIDENQKNIKSVINRRGLWDDAENYSDKIKDKEIDWVLLFSKIIKSEAKKFGFPILQVTRNRQDLKAILKIIK